MKYSALVFGKNASIAYFDQDNDCQQIIQCLSMEELENFMPENNRMYVRLSDKPYVSLLNGLKAVKEENVVVLKKEMKEQELIRIKEELKQYPAIYLDETMQAFDTRLVMFCLQVAIESNFAIDSYYQAVEIFASTPLKRI